MEAKPSPTQVKKKRFTFETMVRITKKVGMIILHNHFPSEKTRNSSKSFFHVDDLFQRSLWVPENQLKFHPISALISFQPYHYWSRKQQIAKAKKNGEKKVTLAVSLDQAGRARAAAATASAAWPAPQSLTPAIDDPPAGSSTSKAAAAAVHRPSMKASVRTTSIRSASL